eukprot:TRINITY_DN2641_c0_g1_i3.p3 TRINITY_DN2641_c0_g1~~TRINITY_DN2641_c0_g1_i3.p3  ORF type:complete len:150 (-),score=65.07 TRINITY_DN2641_c0_g1_i3:202-651(-)
MVVEEAKRSIHDALCVARNFIRDSNVVCGGGSAEISCSIAVDDVADKISGVEQYAVRAFAEALEAVPLALAENAGAAAMPAVAALRARHVAERNPRLGVDCLGVGTADMREQKVFETYMSKAQQFLLATQVVKMILKIDEVITPGGQED